jgi:glycosyltransferase involved in cell wall biosynthesis
MHVRAENSANGDRPLIAMINNVQTPYRIHLHLRIARELPEIRLASVFTHDQGDQAWASSHVDEINPVYFGHGHAVVEQDDPRMAGREWRKGGAIIRWLKENKPAAVFVSGYNDLARLRIISWCHRNGLPCFMAGDSNLRGDSARGVRALVKRVYVSRVVRWVSGVVVFGSLGAAYFARYGATPERTFYVPCEPDYRLIEAVTPQDIADALAKFGLDPARRRIVSCGRLIDVKRVDLVIDAFLAIAAERPDFDLVVIGDGPLAPSLRAKVPAPLRNRVFFTGFVGDQRLVSAVYKGSHVFVQASTYEPWGLVINESVAAGMAVISSDAVGAAPELVRDGENGRVFPSGNLSALVECLRSVTEDARLQACRAKSAEVIAHWRRHGDPVEGLRKALRAVGLPLAAGRP